MIGKIINKKSIYYASTLFIALLVGFYGGIVDILQTSAVLEVNQTLQYPPYFFPMLGVFKILGAIALLLPRSFSTIKQWAYAGFTFDFIAASYSHFAVGDSLDKIIAPLVILGILAISYFLKNKF
ncbi:DoxX family protein [Arcobacter roscoffensis]|uniref:DoxX family protein n=1 Tax=Arcobacter roscoffensis TaxID=2961520 RepID=A0ABY5E5W8_9BACT|nr:DoxX family protein [Arcobacter roscoffensis]UTJ07547.1 DoxX family protein [Arcobacter roscoffensis]|tara:strand:- start:109 stop:483 length:375 start_codon:yes stop_codon:yes gene_type:complete